MTPVEAGTAITGQRLPGDVGTVPAGASEEGIQWHRKIEPLVEAALAEVVAGIGPGAPGANAYPGVELPREVQGAAVVTGQVAADAHLGQHVFDASLHVGAQVTRPGVVVTQGEALVEIALAHPVEVRAQGERGVEGAKEQLAA